MIQHCHQVSPDVTICHSGSLTDIKKSTPKRFPGCLNISVSDIFPPLVRRFIPILDFKRFGIAVLVKILFYQFLNNRGILHIGKEHVNQAGLTDGKKETGCLYGFFLISIILMCQIFAE